MKIPAFDLKRQYRQIQDELLPRAKNFFESTQYVLGEEVTSFEKEMATYLGTKHAIGVSSGTDALWLSLKALGIGPGDRVLTSPFTFFATASAILHAGAEPVFADIDPKTFNLDPEKTEEVFKASAGFCKRLKICPETIKAIIPVHLYGQSADMDPLKKIAAERGIPIVEDACQALGSEYKGTKVGRLGSLGAFSFFPTKNLGAFGDAGLVTTEDDVLADQVKALRVHGSRRKYLNERLGSNCRLDAFQAMVLRIKFKYLEGWITARRDHAANYDKAFRDMEFVQNPYCIPEAWHTYHQYTVRIPGGKREGLQKFLSDQGIGTTVYYPIPVHLQPAVKFLGYIKGDFPQAELACEEALSLPVFPELLAQEREIVLEAIKSYLSS
ncbi:MAG: DegT/DnrJ/EryC1/StrS family aminotransferase [Candidatus Omnitrophota bacterium]